MITQGRLAHHHRPVGYHETVSELPLDRWESDRRDTRNVWAVILTCAVVITIAGLLAMASRSPLYAAQNAPEAADAR